MPREASSFGWGNGVMTTEWYIGFDGQVVGPVDQQQLLDFLKSSEQWRQILVWHVGLPEWKHAKDVEEVAALVAKGPPGPPPLPAPPPEPPKAEAPSIVPVAPIVEAPAAPVVETPAAPVVEAPASPVVEAKPAEPAPAEAVPAPPAEQVAKPAEPVAAPVEPVAPAAQAAPAEPVAPVEPVAVTVAATPEPAPASSHAHAPEHAHAHGPAPASERIEMLAAQAAPEVVAAARAARHATPPRRRWGWSATALTILVLLGVAFAAQQLSRKDSSTVAKATQPSNEVLIERGFAEIVQATTLPKKLDDFTTRLDVTPAGKRLVFHHIIDTTRYLVPPNFTTTVKDKMLSEVCTPATREALKAGGTLEYRFHSQAAFLIGSFEISGNDCGNGQAKG